MKKIGFVLAGFVLAGCLAGYNRPAEASVSSWQKGASIQSRWNTDFSSVSFQQSVSNLAADGANSVTLVIPIHQSNIYSTDVQAGGDTPTDQAIASGIAYAHSKGLSVTLAIHDNPYDGQWRAMINPSDRASWFANYGAQLTHYATLAQANGAQQMILGTELASMTSQTINSSNAGYWQAMLQSVRAKFSGKLTYSAQHYGYMSDAQSLGFWGSLDYIGLSAYYGMGNDSSVSALKSQWANWNNTEVRVLANTYNKPVIFTEVGYQSKSGALNDPGSAYSQGGGVDLTLQNNAYQALFDYWNNFNYMGGVMLWDWSSDPNAGGTGDTNYTPQNKPAEQTMKQWFGNAPTPPTDGGTGTGGGTTPTDPTPPAQPATYTISANAGVTPTVGTSTPISAAVAASHAVSNLIVDIEVYNAGGQRVAQKFFENQSLSSSASTFSFPWTPTAAGNYTIKAGVFTANWQNNLYWNDAAGTFSATTVSTPTPPTDPNPPTTPPTNPTPPTDPTPPQTATIDIWWPSNGATVSGVQPFKAILTNTALTQYVMYWQVDGGQLNQMQDAGSGGAAHKESMVNLSEWNWNSANRYTITFIAKNLSGATLATKSVIITVSH